MKSKVARNKNRLNPDLIASIVLVVTVLLILGPWLLDQGALIVSPSELGSDMIAKQWPNALYIAKAWKQSGQMPLWRRAAMTGIPIVGNPSMRLTYPLYWLILLEPVGWTLTLYCALHLAWMALGTYFFARRALELPPGASLLSALAFAFSAKILAHIGGGHPDLLAALSWLPWLWWAVDRVARRPNWFSVAGAAVALAAQVVTHPPTAWLSVVVTVCWGLSIMCSDRRPGKGRRWLVSTLAACAVGLLTVALSLIQVWPMLELLPLMTREAMTLAESSRYALPTPMLISLLFPTALAFPEWVTYLGMPALALAPASWLARKSSRGWSFFVALVILGTLLSLECAEPLYATLHRVVPGMRWVRVPTRMFFVVQMGWALLAGMGWQALKRIRGRKTLPLIFWWSVLLLLSIIGAAWTHWFPQMLAMPTASVVIALVGLPILAGHAWTQRLRIAAWATLATMAVLESLVLVPMFIAAAPVSELMKPTQTMDFLLQQSNLGRTYSTQGLIPLAQAVSHGIETVDGQDAVQLRHYLIWLNQASGCDLTGYSLGVPTCASPEIDPTAYLRAQPNGKLLGIGHVQYVVTNHDLDQWSSPIWRSDSEKIYENPETLPPAFVVPQVIEEGDDEAAMSLLKASDPSIVAVVPELPKNLQLRSEQPGKARVVRRSSNEIEVEAEGPGWLVVSEVWAPGWYARIDGSPNKVYRTDVAFLGLALPSGSHLIEFEYAPVGWKWGRWVSLITAGLLLVTTTWTLLARLRKRGDLEQKAVP
jgi:hypothetical protein